MQNSETGETEFYTNINEIINFDEETGEPDSGKLKYHFYKKKFNIPKKYLINDNDDKIWNENSIEFTEKCPLENDEMHVKEEIILSYNKTTHRIFLLIPSLFFFTKFAAVLFSIFEILIHIWAHHKNAHNKNKNIYYKSPLHILTSQFCAICRSETEKDHINRLQDRTRRLHSNLKHMTSSFS